MIGHDQEVLVPNLSFQSALIHEDISDDKFQEKYKVLRQAYESRIEKISEVVNITCEKLFSNEVLMGLRNDPTSAAFIPIHVTELFTCALEGEREKYIHELVLKVNTLELEHEKCQSIIANHLLSIEHLQRNAEVSQRNAAAVEPYKQRIVALEEKHAEYVEKIESELSELHQVNESLSLKDKQLSNKLEILKHELSEKSNACEQLKNVIQAKDRDINTLEQSYTENSRELALIEGLEQQERRMRSELKEQVFSLTTERNLLHDENQQLRAKMQYACDELDRCHVIAAQKDQEDAANKQHITELMAQVETMLTQEANESNAAIATVHDKMKAFRQRMSAELSREKRYSHALQEELQTARTQKEDSVREQHRLSEQDAQLREQLATEQQRCFALQRQLQDESQQVTVLKVKLADVQASAVKTAHIHHDYERLRGLETRLIEERAELRLEKSKESEQLHVDQRIEAYKLKYENELAELRKQLKNAYSFEKNSANKASDPSEISYKNTIQSWVNENARLKQRHAVEIAAAVTQVKGEYEEMLIQLQSKLQEASGGIDRLKVMVRDGKTVIRNQHTQIDRLIADSRELKQRLEAAAHERSDMHNNNNNNNSVHYTVSNASSRRASLQSNSSRGSVPMSATRRSSTTSLGLSTRETSVEAHRHRAAIVQRSLSASRATPSHDNSSLNTTQSSHPQQQQDGNSRVSGTSRRSSMSVLGTSHLIHAADVSTEYNSPPRPHSAHSRYSNAATERDISISHEALRNAKDEASTARKSAHAAAEELAHTKGLLESLQREADENEKIIREMRAQLNTSVPRRSPSLQRTSVTSSPEEKVFGQRLDEALLQVKVDEVNSLREKLSNMQQSAAEQEQRLKQELEVLQHEHEDLKRQCSSLSEQLQRRHGEDIDLKKDDVSTIFSDENSDTPGAKSSQDHAKGVTSSFMAPSGYETSIAQMEESVLHHMELSRISAEELAEERRRTRDMRKREVQLFKLLAEVDNVYRQQIHALRQELQDVRGAVQSISSVAAIEVRKTIGGVREHLDRIFRHNEEKRNEEIRQAQIKLSNAHEEEMNALEARFVAQIEDQASQHLIDMDQLQLELMQKTDRVLGLGAGMGIASMAPEASLNDSLDDGDLGTSHQHRPQRAVSFASNDSSNTRASSSSSRRSRRASSGLSAPPPSRRGSLSGPYHHDNSSSSEAPAYESVAKGILDALATEEMIDKSGSQQILALAKAHQEPSFAAQAAARSILAGYLEKYVDNLLHRLSAATSDTSVKNTHSHSAIGNSAHTDFSIFFDSL